MSLEEKESIVSEEDSEILRTVAEGIFSDDNPHRNEFNNWYMLHTYSGFEMRVQQSLEELKNSGKARGFIYQVFLPTEKVSELGKNGKKRITTRKLFPGYIMVQMAMNEFSQNLVQNVSKVTGFVGGKSKPAPMSVEDVRRIFKLVAESASGDKPKTPYNAGDEVHVIDGPFVGFNGVIEEVSQDKGKLRVSVSIFGRQTPVELDFIQVSKN